MGSVHYTKTTLRWKHGLSDINVTIEASSGVNGQIFRQPAISLLHFGVFGAIKRRRRGG